MSDIQNTLAWLVIIFMASIPGFLIAALPLIAPN